jgi:hypothetical protein
MPFTAAAIGAGVSAAAGIAGGIMQKGAVDSATSKANAAQQAGLVQARADLEPWRTTGGTANTATANLLGLNGPDAATSAMNNFQTSPGYTWSRDQGLRAVDAGAAAHGLLRSGATLKAEQTFGTGLADQEFGQYYNRLYQLSNLGESAATGSATASQNTAKDIAATDLSQGSALASIYGNTAQGIGNAANSYANNSLYSSRTNALAPKISNDATQYA